MKGEYKLNGKCPELEKELQLVRNALKENRHQLDDFQDKGVCETRCRNYSYVVEYAPVSIMITDNQGFIEFVNPKFEEVTGYRAEEVIGKNPNILKSGETDAREYNDLWTNILSGKQWTGVFHNRRKNGDLFWERAVITGVKNEQDEISHFIAIKEDVTAIREAREKLKHERLKIIKQSEMAEIGILASGILHEVGNPITAIRGLICDLKDSCEESSEQKDWHTAVDQQLNQVLSEMDRITGITRDFSEFSYTHNGEAKLIDVNAIIGRTCRLIQYDGRWSRIDLRVVLDPDLPAINFIKGQMTQVLINLMRNAAHAVENKTNNAPVVHVSTNHNDKNIFIVIKDNGCGIAHNNLSKIFDVFFTSKAVGEGTGLGLAICKSIIDEHHGTIEISSRIGIGTDVCISLPIENEQEF